MTVADLTIPLNSTEKSTAFRNILVATDFSEASRRALSDALTLAAENNAHVTVVHVLRHDRTYAALENPRELDFERIEAEQRIRTLVNELSPKQTVATTMVTHGPVAEAVARVIEAKKVDLLVIGTRGRGGLQKLALGSIAEEFQRIAPCPVMTIGPRAEFATIQNGAGPHAILFATDFGKGSAKALQITLMLARQQQAKLIMMHMIAPMPASSASLSAYAPATAAADEVNEWNGTSRKRAIQQLRDCLPAETRLSQAPEFIVGTDFLAEGILTAASQFNVDLIVMGANHAASPRIAAHNPWTAVHEVVQDAPCPVLTVAG